MPQVAPIPIDSLNANTDVGDISAAVSQASGQNGYPPPSQSHALSNGFGVPRGGGKNGPPLPYARRSHQRWFGNSTLAPRFSLNGGTTGGKVGASDVGYVMYDEDRSYCLPDDDMADHDDDAAGDDADDDADDSDTGHIRQVPHVSGRVGGKLPYNEGGSSGLLSAHQSELTAPSASQSATNYHSAFLDDLVSSDLRRASINALSTVSLMPSMPATSYGQLPRPPPPPLKGAAHAAAVATHSSSHSRSHSHSHSHSVPSDPSRHGGLRIGYERGVRAHFVSGCGRCLFFMSSEVVCLCS